MIGPHHGHNSSGTCSAVAVQLLLSYHNYYSDRRLIDNKYLFDGEDNPNTCTNPLKMTSETLGTRGEEEKDNDERNYFRKIVKKVPAYSGAIAQAAGLRSLLAERKEELNLDDDLATITSAITIFGVGDKIENEIDQNRPVAIGFHYDNKDNHGVVGYGYQTLGGSGTNQDGQFGYIVHCGWGEDTSNSWINKSWCYDYVTMEVNHEHTFDFNTPVLNEYYERRCTECGYRTSFFPFTTTTENNEVTITGLSDDGNQVILPADFTVPYTINNQKVTRIASNAFVNQTTISNVKIPNSVVEIGNGVFSGCSNLTSLTLPFIGNNRTPTTEQKNFGKIFGTTQYPGSTAVRQDGITYYIPTTLQNVTVTDMDVVKQQSFTNCTMLQNIKLPYGTKTIESGAFLGCTSLNNFIIPNTVTSIKTMAFSDCNSLSSITIPYGVKTIGENVFPSSTRITWIYNPNVSTESLKITSTVDEIIVGNDIDTIKSYAFKDCNNLEEITIGAGVETIEVGVFDGCTLLSSVMWKYNPKVTAMALGINNILTSVEIDCDKNGNKIEKIENYAFKNCIKLDMVSISSSVKNIGVSAFEGCAKLDYVILLNEIALIGQSAFKNCVSLYYLYVPSKITNIEEETFAGCTNLERVDLACNLVSISNSAFRDCTALKSINLPSSLTSIGDSAFEGCNVLDNVILRNNLNTIGNYAFKGCTSLTNIIIPESVTNIGSYAFMNCRNLSQVTVNRASSEITTIGSNSFEGCTSLSRIGVPINRSVEYKSTSGWNTYKDIITYSGEYDTQTISCENTTSGNNQLSDGLNKLYQLNVNCAKTYKIETTSSNDVKIIIYNSNYTVVDTFINQKDIYLGVGTYYISVEFNSLESSGNVELNISLRWPSTDVGLVSGINDIKSNLHNTLDNVCHGKFYYNNNQGKGLFRFTLNTSANTYLNGTIKIYDSSRRQVVLDRYNISNETNQASSKIDENTIYVYLPSNGAFYIDIVLPTSNYSIISLEIEKVENNPIDYSNTLSSTTLTELFSYETFTSYFTEVTISHKSLFELDIITNGTVNNNINIYILKKQLLPGYDTNEYYEIIQKVKVQITSSDHSPVCSSILEEGTYYIGYDNNIDKANISIALVRRVNSDINVSGTLVTDPAYNEGYPLGSEATLNNGVLRGNTITEGFTRNIYLMVEDRLRDPISRLDYDWYSSDENIAKVTAYGTVLALNVTENKTVTIYAVLKTDPSIVYAKTFTILKETKTEVIVLESNMTYSYSEENGMYTLELNFTNSPYPYVGYYGWSINCIDDISVDMDHALLITSSGVGRVDLTGSYSLNSRIFLYIHLTITE